MPSTERLPRFACPDWWEKIQARRTPMPDVPVNRERAAKATAFFNRLKLTDVPGNPPLRTHCGDWFRDIMVAFLASEDPETKKRLVWELLCMVPKKNSKTTYVAALGLTALFMEKTPDRQMLLVAPSQNISERCFGFMQGMIRLDTRLQAIFRVQDHLKRITRHKTGTRLEVKTFDTQVVTGEIPTLTIIDELHELGKKNHAAAVMQQIRGGGITMQGGQVLMITTQSDQRPAGIWKTELEKARAIRDGRGGDNPILLPVLYEFPPDLQKNERYWRNPKNWAPILPNLGKSIDPDRLLEDYENNGRVNPEAETIWVSQHLNIEIGVGHRTGAWAGARFWEKQEDERITLEYILENCEVVIVSLDGGGLDDLYGGNVLGRERGTRDWVSWSHAWCHAGVLDQRQSIASRLLDFKGAGELTIYQTAGEDIVGIIELIKMVKESGLLGAVAVDPAGLGEMVEALADPDVDVTVENKLLVGVPQGYQLMNAIITGERKLQNGTLRHAKSSLMDWCVGNVKIEPMANHIRATKQNAGDAKIDPWAALMNGVFVMSRNPEAGGLSVFDTMGDEQPQADDGSVVSAEEEAAILRDYTHPRWQEMRERFEARLAAQDQDEFV